MKLNNDFNWDNKHGLANLPVKISQVSNKITVAKWQWIKWISSSFQTHRLRDAIRSSLVKLSPALYLVKFPLAVSSEASAPSAKALVPNTLDRLTTGLAVKPMLALTPA
jgi:hypothetical protein